MIPFKPIVKGRTHTLSVRLQDAATQAVVDATGWTLQVRLGASTTRLGSFATLTANGNTTGVFDVEVTAEQTALINTASVIIDVGIDYGSASFTPIALGSALCITEAEYQAGYLSTKAASVFNVPGTSDLAEATVTVELATTITVSLSMAGTLAPDTEDIQSQVNSYLTGAPGTAAINAAVSTYLQTVLGTGLSVKALETGDNLIAITAQGGYFLADPSGLSLNPTASYGDLSFAETSYSVVVTVAEPMPTVTTDRLATYGNQIIDSDGNSVRLRSVNWFGGEGTNYTPHGTWIKAYTDIIDDIASMGFNCIRLPFSGAWADTALTPPTAAIDFDLNPGFTGLTSLEILDLIIAYCGTVGLWVVLDHHRSTAGDGADGTPIQTGYTLSNWIATWEMMATRYGSNTTVIGADIHNEPHSLDWATWAGYAEQAGNAIHAIAPEWLIFVEGVGEYNSATYWWGGQLAGVASDPVVLNTSNKLVYSPHEYGVSVGQQAWLESSSNVGVTNWPDNLYAVWDAAWGFIFRQNIAPIWIGEFGGHFGVDGSGTVGAQPDGDVEAEWVTELINYINGDLDNNGGSLITGQEGMSFSYWSYNPNSGDTGGLVQDDWTTHQTVKLNLLTDLFPATT